MSELAKKLKMEKVSLQQWAIKRGFNPRTVQRTVRNWGHVDRQPHGGVGREIIKKLKQDFDTVTEKETATTQSTA